MIELKQYTKRVEDHAQKIWQSKQSWDTTAKINTTES